jgi:hypothetical protein
MRVELDFLDTHRRAPVIALDYASGCRRPSLCPELGSAASTESISRGSITSTRTAVIADTVAVMRLSRPLAERPRCGHCRSAPPRAERCVVVRYSRAGALQQARGVSVVGGLVGGVEELDSDFLERDVEGRAQGRDGGEEPQFGAVDREGHFDERSDCC